jgi:hypothetical protein
LTLKFVPLFARRFAAVWLSSGCACGGES